MSLRLICATFVCFSVPLFAAPCIPLADYETAISSRIPGPNAWFKLNFTLDNEGSNPNHIPLVNPGPNPSLWTNDVSGNGNSAYFFSDQGDKLTLTEPDDPIGGGTGDAAQKGSFTLLFRALNGPVAGKRYLLSQGISVNNNNALAVYFDGTDAGGALKVAVGNTQVAPQKLREEIILLPNNIAFGAWYYLAVTCDEDRVDNEVRWYLGRVGASTLNSGSFTLATTGTVFGDNGTITVGNKGNSLDSAYQSPGNGCIDQVTFWNRELDYVMDILPMFNALPHSGLSANFDLTHWELMLPVNRVNQLVPADKPLIISAGGLNSGFEYLHPSLCTEKYFFQDANGKMVCEAPFDGASGGTASPRSELRGTKADGNEDNWKPSGTHILDATCAVNSGTSKVIIGQIHAKTPDVDPGPSVNGVPAIILSYQTGANGIKLTVKKDPDPATLPNAPNPQEVVYTFGLNIPLGGEIRYQLKMVGVQLYVTVNEVKAKLNGVTKYPINMAASPYVAGWNNATLYFKAGCYYPDSVGGTAMVTFSSLSQSHSDAPIITTTVAPLNYTENAAATAIDPGLNLADADSEFLSSATVTISAGFLSSQDVVGFTIPGGSGIVGYFNSADGVLSLTGHSSVANYLTALRSVTYRNTSDNPTTARTIAFRAYDGFQNSAVASRSINITPVNDAPTLTTVSTLTGGIGDTPFTISYATLAAAANEADIEGNAISFRVEAISSGSLSVPPGTLLSAGGNWVWDPPADALGTLNAFTVKAWDGALASATPIQVTVSVVAGPGGLDTTFNPGSGANGIIRAAAVLSDGKILIGGDFTHVNGIATPYLAMLASDGSVITGSYFTGAPDGPVYSIVTEPDPSRYYDRIVIGGLFSSFAGNFSASLASLRYNGTVYQLEPYFGDYLNYGPPTYSGPATVRTVAFNGTGYPGVFSAQIFAGGDFVSPDATREINRIGEWWETGGAYLEYFSSNPFSYPEGADATVRSVKWRPVDGWIYIGGDFHNVCGQPRNYVALLSWETLQPASFAPSPNNSVYAIAVYGPTQPDYDDILIGGLFTMVNGINRGRIARLNSDGTLDLSFAGGGGANGAVNAVAFDSTGLPVIGGAFTTVDSTARNRIARLTAAGALDTTFAGGTGANGEVHAIAVQSDGKILIVGSFTTYKGVPRSGIARLLKQ